MSSPGTWVCMSRRDAFVWGISQALMNGSAKSAAGAALSGRVVFALTRPEALERANQVADALPALWRDE